MNLFGWYWERVGKFHPEAAKLADRHYSRRKIGSDQFMPPGQTVILLGSDHKAVFGWHRPHPDSGIELMSGMDGWTCTIFRNEGKRRSSDLILDAEDFLKKVHPDCGPDGFLTYVFRDKVRSKNPGCCFKKAGWKKIGESADGKKDLLQKPWMTF